MIDGLFKKCKEINAQLKDAEMDLYNAVHKEFIDFVTNKGGEIDFEPLLNDTIDISDCEWMNMDRRGSVQWGYVYKVSVETAYGQTDLVFYGYDEDGYELIADCDSVSGLDLYHLYKFFTIYSD